jgi:hypothetical protein
VTNPIPNKSGSRLIDWFALPSVDPKVIDSTVMDDEFLSSIVSPPLFSDNDAVKGVHSSARSRSHLAGCLRRRSPLHRPV